MIDILSSGLWHVVIVSDINRTMEADQPFVLIADYPQYILMSLAGDSSALLSAAAAPKEHTKIATYILGSQKFQTYLRTTKEVKVTKNGCDSSIGESSSS